MPFVAWLDQIIHLAKQVNEKDGFVIEVLESMDLFLVEVLHFVRSDNQIVVQVYDFEPVTQTALGSLVLFRQHEPNEVLVIHLVFLLAFEFARNLIKNSINSFSR